MSEDKFKGEWTWRSSFFHDCKDGIPANGCPLVNCTERHVRCDMCAFIVEEAHLPELEKLKEIFDKVGRA
jgi:hypothetical protein